jgi:flagellar motor switch/type III secretory pathway protein FliN
MATAQPPPAAPPLEQPRQHPAPELAAEQALVTMTAVPGSESGGNSVAESGGDSGTGRLIAPNSPVARLPVELDVAIPVRDFRVRNLLALEPGHLIETQWVNGEDMPLAAGLVQLAWTEFEVLDTELAVRVTRLA